MREVLHKYIVVILLSILVGVIAFIAGFTIGTDIILKKVIHVAYSYMQYQNISLGLSEYELRDFADKFLSLI
jgi:hypothetical protein